MPIETHNLIKGTLSELKDHFTATLLPSRPIAPKAGDAWNMDYAVNTQLDKISATVPPVAKVFYMECKLMPKYDWTINQVLSGETELSFCLVSQAVEIVIDSSQSTTLVLSALPLTE